MEILVPKELQHLSYPCFIQRPSSRLRISTGSCCCSVSARISIAKVVFEVNETKKGLLILSETPCFSVLPEGLEPST